MLLSQAPRARSYPRRQLSDVTNRETFTPQRKELTMHTDAIMNGDGQRWQVGSDPLDYVLRYAVGDYDCYFQGRYIGSRPTLPKAVEAIEYEQAKARRHPQPS